jgi:hypothetical protein
MGTKEKMEVKGGRGRQEAVGTAEGGRGAERACQSPKGGE